MTDMRSNRWREEHDLFNVDSERGLDEASRVIRSAGGLNPVIVGMNEATFNTILRQSFAPIPTEVTSFEPDYLGSFATHRSNCKSYTTADMFAWHARKNRNATMDLADQRRYWRMTEGDTTAMVAVDFWAK
jgi:hypothetical protein